MFYVGVVSSFTGTVNADKTQVHLLEKLGHSKGRAKRFLDSHKPYLYALDGLIYRAIVCVLSDRFRLNNEVIKLAMQQYTCSWNSAKFHCYRISALEVMGNKVDWLDIFPEPASTATPAPPLSETAIDSNVSVDPVKALPVAS